MFQVQIQQGQWVFWSEFPELDLARTARNTIRGTTRIVDSETLTVVPDTAAVFQLQRADEKGNWLSEGDPITDPDLAQNTLNDSQTKASDQTFRLIDTQNLVVIPPDPKFALAAREAEVVAAQAALTKDASAAEADAETSPAIQPEIADATVSALK